METNYVIENATDDEIKLCKDFILSKTGSEIMVQPLLPTGKVNPIKAIFHTNKISFPKIQLDFDADEFEYLIKITQKIKVIIGQYDCDLVVKHMEASSGRNINGEISTVHKSLAKVRFHRNKKTSVEIIFPL